MENFIFCAVKDTDMKIRMTALTRTFKKTISLFDKLTPSNKSIFKKNDNFDNLIKFD